MKPLLLAGTLPLLLLCASGQVCFDPFADAAADGGTSYTVGSSLCEQVNSLGATWYAITNTPASVAAGFPVIAAGSLSYPGLPPSTGKCISIPSRTGVMGRLALGFTVTSGTAYYSFLLKVTDLSGVDASGVRNNFFAGFGDNVGNQNATLLRATVRLYARRAGSGFNLGVARNSSHPADWVFERTRRSLDTVLFVVGGYDYGSHTARLWVNPPSSSFGSDTPPAPTITASAGADLNSNGIRAFVLGCRTNPPPGCLVDELRIGTTWAYVTGAPGIAVQPADEALDVKATATLSVKAAGGRPLGYEWRKDGVALSNSGRVFGADTAVLSVSNMTRGDAGGYSVMITNSYGAITSSVATLTVNNRLILGQPVTQVLPAGTNAVFRVIASGDLPLAYQWYKDGAPLGNTPRISGANAATLTVSNIAEGDVGAYWVGVTSGSGDTVLSRQASLFIADPSLAARRPNILFILCDDLGYGDLGVLYQNRRAPGLPRETTPHMDTLAAEGMRLDMHYCSAPVCAPSRASLLLGVHQGHANVRDQQWDKALADNHTLATVLREAGYATAAIGKWGLGGDNVGGTAPADWAAYPTRRGFDYFFGYERHGDGHEHYPKEALYSRKSKECYDGAKNITAKLDKCYTTDLFTARAKKWIADQHAAQPRRPFFLYLAFDTPHAVYELPTQAYPRGGGLAGGLQWLGTPGHMINTASGTVDSYVDPDYAAATYDDDRNPATPEVPWPEVFRRYAMGVRRIDDAVGDLMQLLRDLAIDNNTLVILTSDNGPTIEDYLSLTPKYRGNFFDTFGPLDGVKRDTWEGGIRMPTIVRWPGTIAAGAIVNTPSQFQDWMPTFTELAGLPGPARSDGASLVPTLLGIGKQPPSTIYVEYADPYRTPKYHEFTPAHRGRVHNQMQVIRLNGLQGVRYDITAQSNDFEIYDVVHDPQEATNLAANPAYLALQHQMKDRVLQLRRPDPSAPRPYDAELVPSVPASATAEGVEWKAYTEAFPWVPELTALTNVCGGVTNQPTLAVRPRDDDIGLLFTGYLLTPADGNYTFYLSADTGALLRLHEATVIDADFGYVGGKERNGVIKLKAGLHPFRLYYARRSAGIPAMSFAWSGPGFSKEPVPASAFRRKPRSADFPVRSSSRSTPGALLQGRRSIGHWCGLERPRSDAGAGAASPFTNTDLLLADSGRAHCTITTAIQPSPAEAFAARELQRYLGAMSGARFDVSTGSVQRSILVCKRDSIPAGIRLPGGAAQLPPDGYCMARRQGNLLLIGADERGTLYAAYALLERLGCRWLAPAFAFYDGAHEVVPDRPRLSLSFGADMLEQPVFKYRKLYVEEGRSDTTERLLQLIDWMPRRRFNTLAVPLNYGGGGRVKWDNWREALTPELQRRGITIEVGGHGYQNYLNAQMEGGQLFARHPEWFCQDASGRRVSHPGAVFCTSNEQARGRFIENVRRYLDEHPEIQVFDLWPPDGARWCECPNCTALGSPSDRQARLLAAVSEAICPTRSNLIFETVAYGACLAPPVRAFMDPRVLVDFCPIRQCFEWQIDDPRSSENAAYAAQLEAWLRVFPGEISIYSYYRKYAWRSLPVLLPHYMQNDLRYYARAGVRGISSYAEPGDWGTYELNHYVLGGLSWDPGADVDAMIRDFAEARFGGQAALGRRAFQVLEDTVRHVCELPGTANKTSAENERAAGLLSGLAEELQKTGSAAPNPAAAAALHRLWLATEYARRDVDLRQAAAGSHTTAQRQARAKELNRFLQEHADDGMFLVGVP